MGKRSNFGRIDKDFYKTFDRRALPPLINYFQHHSIRPLNQFYFSEPCVGEGDLKKQLVSYGLNCVHESDIMTGTDALTLKINDLNRADMIITNPPWSRDILHPMIEHFANLTQTYLLFDSAWIFTKQSSELLTRYCTDIIPIGRLRWIEGTKWDGKDDCSWYKFTSFKNHDGIIRFHPRIN